MDYNQDHMKRLPVLLSNASPPVNYSPFSLSPSMFSLGLRHASQMNPWSGASLPHSFLPNGGPAHVPRSLATPDAGRMPNQNENYQSVPNASYSQPAPTNSTGYDIGTVYRPFPQRWAQFSAPSSASSPINCFSVASPSTSTSFVGYSTPVLRVVNHTSRRLLSPLFSLSRNGRPEMQYPTTPNGMVKPFTDSPIDSFPMSAHSSSTSPTAIQMPAPQGMYNPQDNQSSQPLTPSSTMVSISNANCSLQPAIDNLLQWKGGESVVHGKTTVGQRSPIPQHHGLKAHDADHSTLLQGEIEKDQHFTFDQASETGYNLSSKAHLDELDEAHAQHDGRRPPTGRRGRTCPSKRRKQVVRKKAKPDYSVEYADTQKSSPYPGGLRWAPSVHVEPLNGSLTNLPASSSPFPQETEVNEAGTPCQRSEENQGSEQHLSLASTSSSPSPEHKRKQEGGEATHSSSSTSPSSMQAPPAKRQKPLPKEMVEHRTEICEGWEASTFGPPVEKEPFISWEGPRK